VVGVAGIVLPGVDGESTPGSDARGGAVMQDGLAYSPAPRVSTLTTGNESTMNRACVVTAISDYASYFPAKTHPPRWDLLTSGRGLVLLPRRTLLAVSCWSGRQEPDFNAQHRWRGSGPLPILSAASSLACYSREAPKVTDPLFDIPQPGLGLGHQALALGAAPPPGALPDLLQPSALVLQLRDDVSDVSSPALGALTGLVKSAMLYIPPQGIYEG
jgi:hypothetical protein